MYPTITTFLHDDEAPTAAFEWALSAARTWRVHLNVICAGIDATEPGFYYAGAQAFAVNQNLDVAQENANRLEKIVTERLSREVVAHDVQTVTLMGANVAMFLAERARMNDLVVLPAPYAKTRQHLDVLAVETCLFESRVPVVVIPDAYAGPIEPKKVLLAWNEAPEALIAAKTALPLLTKAEAVLVTIIDPPSHAANRSDPGGRLAQFLSRHGAKPEISVLGRSQSSTATILCQRAFETDCEMIVMGAYGHSRLRESILGGATRDMLEAAEIPVLMAH